MDADRSHDRESRIVCESSSKICVPGLGGPAQCTRGMAAPLSATAQGDHDDCPAKREMVNRWRRTADSRRRSGVSRRPQPVRLASDTAPSRSTVHPLPNGRCNLLAWLIELFACTRRNSVRRIDAGLEDTPGAVNSDDCGNVGRWVRGGQGKPATNRTYREYARFGLTNDEPA